MSRSAPGPRNRGRLNELTARFSHAAGRPIAYQRFPDSVLDATPFLARLTQLLDDGRLAGNADIAALRGLHSGLLTVEQWLSGPGRSAFERSGSARCSGRARE